MSAAAMPTLGYRRRPTALHAARAAVAGAWCAAAAAVGLAAGHPLVLGALLAGLAGAGYLAGVGAQLRAVMRLAVPLALLVAAVNALVSREGVTVIARLGEVPALGPLDVTLEATAWGAVLGLRAAVVVLACAVAFLCVDPDQALRGLRRASVRSGLTASLATRLVPVLARDAARLAEGRRCRWDGGGRGAAAHLAVVRAVTAGALERAVDIAATLEVRGYALGHRPPRRPRPWGRHDVAFAAAAAVLAACAAAPAVAGAGAVQAYPRLDVGLTAADATLAVAVLAALLLPFADRRGVPA